MNRCILCSTELVVSKVICRECRLLLRNGNYFDPDLEVWLPVVDYEGLYEVSNLGRVRSLDCTRTYVRGGQRAPGTVTARYRGRALTPITDKDGYQIVGLTSAEGRQTRRLLKVHALVLASFVGPRPPGMQGCHWDDDPANNHLPNLRWDTASGNKQDEVRNGHNANANKTHCPAGHEYTPANTRVDKNGSRGCRACARDTANERYHRGKESAA